MNQTGLQRNASQYMEDATNAIEWALRCLSSTKLTLQPITLVRQSLIRSLAASYGAVASLELALEALCETAPSASPEGESTPNAPSCPTEETDLPSTLSAAGEQPTAGPRSSYSNEPAGDSTLNPHGYTNLAIRGPFTCAACGMQDCGSGHLCDLPMSRR